MIKHTIIAGAVLALASTTAIAEEKAKAINWDVNAFGEVRAYGELSSKDNVDAEIKSDSTKFGIKLDGTTGGVGIFGELSANVNINDSDTDTVNTRFGYVGVSLSKIGDISLGKQMSIQEQFVDKADVFYSAGNNSVQKMSFTQNNSVKYMNEIAGVKIGALAAMTDDTGDNDLDRYQLGAEYMGLGVSFGKDDINSKTYMGVGYSKSIGKFGIYGSYSLVDTASNGVKDRLLWNTDNTSTVTRGYELAVSYAMDDAITLTGGFNDTDATGDQGTAVGEVSYKISDNAVAFSNMELDVDGSDTTTRAGISITF